MEAPLEAIGGKRDGLGTQDLSLCKNRTSRHGMDTVALIVPAGASVGTGIRTFYGPRRSFVEVRAFAL